MLFKRFYKIKTWKSCCLIQCHDLRSNFNNILKFESLNNIVSAPLSLWLVTVPVTHLRSYQFTFTYDFRILRVVSNIFPLDIKLLERYILMDMCWYNYLLSVYLVIQDYRLSHTNTRGELDMYNPIFRIRSRKIQLIWKHIIIPMLGLDLFNHSID